MKIALFTDGIYPFQIGGMQKHSWYLARYLAKSGAIISIYHSGSPKNSHEAFSKEEKKSIHEVKISWPRLGRFPGHYLIENYFYSRNISRHFRSEPECSDLIYCQGLTGWDYLKTRENDERGRVPVLVNLHGLEMFQEAPGARARAEQLLLAPIARYQLRKADYVVSLGGKLTDLLERQGLSRKKIVEIPIGIERHWKSAESREPSLPGQRKFVFIGRHESRKGLPLLHQVIEKLAGETSNAEFIIVGPVPDHLRLRTLNVRYTGSIKDESDIRSLLLNTDVLVLPSYSEGMPTVILEAMATGNAIICSDVGATSCLVDRDNGWLVEAGDLSALELSIREANELDHSGLHSKMSCSIEKSTEYFWEKVAAFNLKEFQEIIEKSM